MTTKIHAIVDALGNPTGFHLTPGQAHDLKEADVLLKDTQADTVIADKAYDAQARLIEPLVQAGKVAVIAPTSSRRHQRSYDRQLYQARHLIENFFSRPRHCHALRKNLAQLPGRHTFGCHYRLAQLITRPRL